MHVIIITIFLLLQDVLNKVESQVSSMQFKLPVDTCLIIYLHRHVLSFRDFHVDNRFLWKANQIHGLGFINVDRLSFIFHSVGIAKSRAVSFIFRNFCCPSVESSVKLNKVSKDLVLSTIFLFFLSPSKIR